MINIWVLYESRLGNTSRLAAAIAQSLARSERVRLLSATQAGVPAGVQLILIGVPSHRNSKPNCVFDWLRRLPNGSLKGIPFSVFDLRYTPQRWFEFSITWKIGRAIQRQGGRYAGSPETFFLSGHEGPVADGEIHRACAWANQILHNVVHSTH